MLKILSIVLSLLFILPNNQPLNNEIDALNLSSKNYIVYNYESDQVLASKDADIRLQAASINKVLTTITIIDSLAEIPLDQEVIVQATSLNKVPIEASKASLFVGQKLSVKELLYAIILPSGADAIAVLSDFIFVDQAALVKAMNAKAAEIGMDNTNIVNIYGLDDKTQYTSLEDLLKLVKYALKNEVFSDVYGMETYNFINNPKLQIENKSLTQAKDLNFNYMYGAKSGYTVAAQRALSSYAGNEDLSYILITTGAKTGPNLTSYAVNDAVKVYNYLFDNYHIKDLSQTEVSNQVKVKWRLQPVKLKHNVNLEAAINDKINLEEISFESVYQEDLKAPLQKGQVIGKDIFTYQDEVIFEKDIILDKSIGIGLTYKIILLLLIISISWITYKILKNLIRK